MKRARLILYILLAVFFLLQFVPVDRSIPQSIDSSLDLIEQEQMPEHVAQLIQSACYDCHSYRTEYPWYAYTAPAKWILQNHVTEGREHLNFSLWGSYSADKRAHKAEECVEEIEENHMPPAGYAKLHPEAVLTPAQQKKITTFFISLK